MKRYIVFASIYFLSACTWVELSNDAEQVLLVELNQASHCEKLGNITTKTHYTIGGTPRSAKKISKELSILARNEAVQIDANTIVAKGQPQEGQQMFSAYRCPR